MFVSLGISSYSSVVEHMPYKRGVVGAEPTRRTMSSEMSTLLRHAHSVRKTTFWMLGVQRAWLYDSSLLIKVYT